MAYFRKIKTGVRAEVQRNGIRDSQVFKTMGEARAWAAVKEAAILTGKEIGLPNKTLAQAIERYTKDISANKRSSKAERLRFDALQRDFPEMCGKLLRDVRASDIAHWRDARMQVVSASTVAREATPIRHLFNVAMNEWEWITETPWKKVKLAPEAPPRTRQTTPSEVRILLRRLGYATGKAPASSSKQTAYAYLIAQHTAMRAGEVLSLSMSTVNLDTRVARLVRHKTMERDGTRFVPFTRKAARLMAVLAKQAKAAGRDAYFTISSKSLDRLFRKARDHSGLSEIHFHDARADALTRLSRRVDAWKLAKISGHRDIGQLLKTYYRASAEDIAAAI